MATLEKHVKGRSSVPAMPTKRDTGTEGMAKQQDYSAKVRANDTPPRMPKGGNPRGNK